MDIENPGSPILKLDFPHPLHLPDRHTLTALLSQCHRRQARNACADLDKHRQHLLNYSDR